MSEHTKEQFREQVSLLRKYSFEFSSQRDDETYDLMIASQVQLHKLYDDAQAEITALKASNKELKVTLADERKSANELAKLLVDKVRINKELIEGLEWIANVNWSSAKCGQIAKQALAKAKEQP